MPEIIPPKINAEENDRLVIAAEYLKRYVHERADENAEISIQDYIKWLSTKMTEAVDAIKASKKS